MRNLLILSVCLFCSAQFALAQDSNARQFSSRAGVPVSEAAELLSANDNAGALAKLDQALALSGLTPFEQANIHQMRGAAFYEMDKIAPAITAFEAAMNSGGFNTEETDALFAQTAQLYMASGFPAKGAQMLEDWAGRGGKITSAHIDMLTQSWIEAKQNTRALPWAKKWFAAANPKTRKHYNLMNYLYNALEKPQEQSHLVKDMIERWPEDRSLWENWAALLSQAGKEQDAFEVNRLMYFQGLFTSEADILKLIQYHGYFDVPYEGAKLLEKEMAAGQVSETSANLKNLSNLWRQARAYDKAIPVLNRAASLGGDKTTYAELAEALINQGKCEEAETAFTSAMDKGYAAGKPWMLIGTCRYEAAQVFSKPSCDISQAERMASKRTMAQNQASKAFNNVTRPVSLRQDAQTWISFIRAEQSALEDRCEFIITLRVDACFADYQQAYANQIFNQDQLILRDDTCAEHKEAYDAEYRRSNAKTEEG